MTAQIVTAEELIGYLADIVDKHGDIPVVIGSESGRDVESVGRPLILPAISAGDADGFQAYNYASLGAPQDASQIKVALIN